MRSAYSPASGRFSPPSEESRSIGLKGVGLHDMRSDVSAQHLTEKGVGNKRSNSDFTNAEHDGFDKMYQGGTGSEQPRRPNNEENFYWSKLLKPASLSQALIPHMTHSNSEEYSGMWDRTVSVNNVQGSVQYPLYNSTFARQVHPVGFKDAAAGPSVISCMVADEGSRNGKKESGWNLVKSSVVSNKINQRSEGHTSEDFGVGRNVKTRAHLPEPKSSLPGPTKSSSSSRKMTIFYDGHAYVFDDVHPHKAEVIMAMAASFSSTFLEKSSMRQLKEGSTPTGKIETGTFSNTDLVNKQQGKLSTAVTSSHKFRSSDPISTLAGADQDRKGVK